MELYTYDEKKPYIFFSYSHKKPAKALSLLRIMQTLGYCVWFDKGIHGGDEWDEIIENKIKNCSCMIFFANEYSVDSEVCRSEVKLAIKEKKTVITVKQTEKQELKHGLDLQLGSKQMLFYPNYKTVNDWASALSKISAFEKCKEAQTTYHNGFTANVRSNKETGSTAHYETLASCESQSQTTEKTNVVEAVLYAEDQAAREPVASTPPSSEKRESSIRDISLMIQIPAIGIMLVSAAVTLVFSSWRGAAYLGMVALILGCLSRSYPIKKNLWRVLHASSYLIAVLAASYNGWKHPDPDAFLFNIINVESIEVRCAYVAALLLGLYCVMWVLSKKRKEV